MNELDGRWFVTPGWTRAHMLRSRQWTLCGREVRQPLVMSRPDLHGHCHQCERRQQPGGAL